MPYVKGVSEPLRRCLQQTRHLRRLASSPTRHLGQYLVQPKDTVDPAKQDGVVYRIPCECGKDYIGETGRSMLEKIKEQDRDIPLAIPRPPSFLSTPIRPATTRFEMR